MKKHIKKLKKTLSKKVESFKQYIRAQSFYLKLIGKQLATSLVFYTRYLTLACFIILASISSSFIHTSYLEHKVGSNTVYIRSPKDAIVQGSATGFEIKAPSGKVYTLTNAHVCGLANANGILMVQEKRYSDRLIPKHVIEIYEDNDLCLVEGLQGYEGLTVASSSDISDAVWAIGYPLGEAMNISSGRIKNFGIVQIGDMETPAKDCTGKSMKMEKFDTLFGQIEICVIEREAAMTDVPTYPGNSGSALVNVYGNVEGVIFASNSESHWGSAVPLDDVIRFIKPY